MNEKIKEIAIFDGYIVAGKWVQLDTPNYLTDLNALHRLALDVMERLYPILTTEEAISAYCKVKDTLLSRPINGQYTDLVDAVYDAIVYLKQHNQCQPK